MAIKRNSWHFKFLRLYDSTVGTTYTKDLRASGGAYSCTYCFHVVFKLLLSFIMTAGVLFALLMLVMGLIVASFLLWIVITWIPAAFMLPIYFVLGNTMPWPEPSLVPGFVMLSIVVWGGTLVMGTAAFYISRDFYIASLSEESLEKRRQTKEPGIIYKWYKAKKDKVCPWEPLE